LRLPDDLVLRRRAPYFRRINDFARVRGRHGRAERYQERAGDPRGANQRLAPAAHRGVPNGTSDIVGVESDAPQYRSL